MFCKKCGTKLSSEARFCKKCGITVTATKVLSSDTLLSGIHVEPISVPIHAPQVNREVILPVTDEIIVSPVPVPIESLVELPATEQTPQISPYLPTERSAIADEATIQPGMRNPNENLLRKTELIPIIPIESGESREGSESSGRQSFTKILIVATVLVIGSILVLWFWGGTETLTPAIKQNANIVVSTPPGMVYVQGGEMMMGNDNGPLEERPAHKVVVKPFFIDRNEVTCEEYAKFLSATNHRIPTNWIKGRYPDGFAQRPITHVDWDDANAYAIWAGKRLPTEQEWEFAARGSDGRRYPWGTDWRVNSANLRDSNFGQVNTVGSYSMGVSPFGVNDMVGNAWEWTSSDWIPYPGGSLPNSNLKRPLKVLRGGCYLTGKEEATTTFRMGWPARGDNIDETGFRCVKDV